MAVIKQNNFVCNFSEYLNFMGEAVDATEMLSHARRSYFKFPCLGHQSPVTVHCPFFLHQICNLNEFKENIRSGKIWLLYLISPKTEPSVSSAKTCAFFLPPTTCKIPSFTMYISLPTSPWMHILLIFFKSDFNILKIGIGIRLMINFFQRKWVAEASRKMNNSSIQRTNIRFLHKIILIYLSQSTVWENRTERTSNFFREIQKKWIKLLSYKSCRPEEKSLVEV